MNHKLVDEYIPIVFDVFSLEEKENNSVITNGHISNVYLAYISTFAMTQLSYGLDVAIQVGYIEAENDKALGNKKKLVKWISSCITLYMDKGDAFYVNDEIKEYIKKQTDLNSIYIELSKQKNTEIMDIFNEHVICILSALKLGIRTYTLD